MTKINTMKDLWRPIAELKDKYASGLLLCAPELIDLDCNPEGIGMGYWQDGGGVDGGNAWLCAKWSMTNDEWYEKECNPTHFIQMTGP